MTPTATDNEASDRVETFAEWLLALETDGPIANLVEAAKTDRLFPRKADPDQTRLHISAMGGGGEWFQIVDLAEADWLAS